jgi:hypothetical protein
MIDRVTGRGLGLRDEQRQVHVDRLHEPATRGTRFDRVHAERLLEQRRRGGFDGIAVQAALDELRLDLRVPADAPDLLEDRLPERRASRSTAPISQPRKTSRWRNADRAKSRGWRLSRLYATSFSRAAISSISSLASWS